MPDNSTKIDLRAMANALRENIQNFGGFSPEQIRKSAVISEETVRDAILKSLESGSKNGQEILKDVQASPRGSSISASAIYPLLENLVDLNLIDAKFVKDRRTFSLTKKGKEHAAAVALEPATEPQDSKSPWSLPNWVDLTGELPKSILRLSNLAIEVSHSGSKEQQKAAAEAIDEARRKIHSILATD